jgi:hypothetical protein
MTRAAWVAALVVACAPAAAQAALATFPAHSVSVGARGGLAYLSMSDVNDLLRLRDTESGSRFEDLHRAWEASLDVRYALTDKFFLGLEGGVLRGRAHDRGSASELRASGVPVVLHGGLVVDQSDAVCVRALAGLGVMVASALEEPGVGKVDGTAFVGYVGGEIELRVASALGLTLQGLARSAMLARPDDAPYDVDFSGGAVRAGLSTYWGSGR